MKNQFDALQAEFKSLYKLAKDLGVTPNAVYNWKLRNVIPMKHLRSIEKLSEGRITRLQMRPDVFGE